MRYQLVLQFSASALAEFDQLVALEAKLIEQLDGLASVDGHDFGQSEFNIFILTDKPTIAFEKAHPIVRNQKLERDMRAAYREQNGETYVILWPLTLGEFAIL